METEQSKTVKIITTKDYVKENGEIRTVVLEMNVGEEKAYTNYRQTQLISEAWNTKSKFVKLFTTGKQPQYKNRAMAQDYLNLTVFVKPETNSLGYMTNDKGWIDFDKNSLREALDMNYKAFSRFFKASVEMNVLSEYGRNDKKLIYLNPRYLFNGKQLHIDLCLAFDHDNKFLSRLTEKAYQDYQDKKQKLLSSEGILEDDIIEVELGK